MLLLLIFTRVCDMRWKRKLYGNTSLSSQSFYVHHLAKVTEPQTRSRSAKFDILPGPAATAAATTGASFANASVEHELM
jgi:hypothetical protein